MFDAFVVLQVFANVLVILRLFGGLWYPLAMPAPCHIVSLTFSLTLTIVSLWLPVQGKMCSAVTRAAAGDDLTALRDKAFAAFRGECRMKKEHQLDESRSK